MRALLTLTTIIVLGWSAYWGAGYQAQKTALENWVTQQQQAGWTVDIDDLKIAGYPNRFDTTFTGLTLADPAQGWSWQAPAFQILALSYKPNHIIATWPGKHILTLKAGAYAFESTQMRASLVFKPETSLALDRLQLEAGNTDLQGPNGLNTTAGTLKLAFVSNPAAATNVPEYNAFVGIMTATLAPEWQTLIDPEGLLPATITEARIDTTLRFDRPWDRFAAESTPPNLVNILLKDLHLEWGQVTIHGEGEGHIAATGYLEGQFTLHVENWHAVFQVAKTAGFIAAQNAGKIEYSTRLLAALSENPDIVKIPLKFANGNTYFGPVIVGEAPNITY